MKTQALGRELNKTLDRADFIRTKYDGKEFDATVHWFDELSGDGMVKLKDGESLHLMWTCIEGWSKDNFCYPTEADRAMLKNIQGKACKVVCCVLGAGKIYVKSCKIEGIGD